MLAITIDSILRGREPGAAPAALMKISTLLSMVTGMKRFGLFEQFYR